MTGVTSPFDQLQATLASNGATAALDQAAALLRQQKKYHELFEVLKMRLRRALGLPLLPMDDPGTTFSPGNKIWSFVAVLAFIVRSGEVSPA